ncbi:NAD+ synthase [Vicingaceae bacterium]|nr:NAD+ synthase [Vicingaceae bacterium]MDC0004742.1 NAD+ synthase [bacterium]MDC1450931.1 NAD+ synthase [Vicingaceae bacterium]
MKIALAQLNYHIGNFEANEAKILTNLQKAKAENVDLVVFSELAVCGYPPRDFLEFENFILLCLNSIERIAKECVGIAAIVGGPSWNTLKSGKKLFNTAFFLSEGKVTSKHNKQLLPTYDVFDEYRYFEPAHEVQCIEYLGEKIALTICEDLWNIEGKEIYPSSPMEKLHLESPDFMINIAASPFAMSQTSSRDEVLKWNTKKYNLPVFYVNHVGAQTELIFDGGSCVYNKQGNIVSQLPFFEEYFSIFDTKDLKVKENRTALSKYEKMEAAIVLGIKDYFKKLNFKTATLGLSGGIDSALTLTLAVKALGKKNVSPILMPSQFSSDHSISDSTALCKNLGCNYQTIEIEKIYKSFDKELTDLFKGTEFGIAEENIQSRVRGTLLMAQTNKFGSILLNTSNKSELAVGYGTLYGDMAGGLSVIGDVYKTEVFELCRYINRESEIIPNNIIIKPPSAELRPDQFDSDSLPDYDCLDTILFEYIENRQSPANLIEKGFDETLVRRILKLVNINEYKRHQTPPILRVSSKAFGMGRRMPIVGKYLS